IRRPVREDDVPASELRIERLGQDRVVSTPEEQLNAPFREASPRLVHGKRDQPMADDPRLAKTVVLEIEPVDRGDGAVEDRLVARVGLAERAVDYADGESGMRDQEQGD